jgi:hypothetical protein
MAGRHKSSKDLPEISTEASWGEVLCKRDDFVTLHTLLNTDPWDLDYVHHHALADEIDQNGIFRFYGSGVAKLYPGNSREAAATLVLISQHLLHTEKYGPGTEYENWNIEQDISGSYGWPKANLPNFQNTHPTRHWIEAFWTLRETALYASNEICSLSRLLLTRKANPAGIMCAIEESGIFKVDATGRPTYIKYDPLTCIKLIQEIEEYAQAFNSDNFYNADTLLLSKQSLLSHGWLYDDLPNFDDLLENHRLKIRSAGRGKALTSDTNTPTRSPAEADKPPPVMEGGTNTPTINSLGEGDESPKTKISRDHVICGLILLIEGKLGEVQIPMPELEIRKFFEKTYPEVTGCSENHLRKVFKDALAHSHSGFGIAHESVDSGRPKK